MSAPNLRVWLPWVRVQLLTNWNCCSLSVSGQLHRATLRPLPKFENVPLVVSPELLKKKADNPPVVGRPLIPVAQFVFGNLPAGLTVFRHGNPRASMGAEFWSE